MTPEPFDACGPLPGPGVTVLEASAGTGKTFTIAALMTRMVAEGLPISSILAVTFTRMATGELRDRIRARLVSAEDGMGRLLAGPGLGPPDDDVLALLASGTPQQVRARHGHLARAVAGFDAATVTTTHGFCQLVLEGMGVAGEVAHGARLLEDARDLVEEVVDDLYLERVRRWGLPAFDRREAGLVGWSAFRNADARLLPEPDRTDGGRRRRLAERVRREVGRRLREANLLTYDDLLSRLQQTLADPVRGEAACARLRDRYRVVLVDEFQDTDPVQWEVVRRAFGSGGTTLVLIGDPKQAIYAFRGADVFAYLAAAEAARNRFTLTRNWRSDKPLLDAFEALLDPLLLGHPDIPYRRVEARPGHEESALRAAPAPAPLRVRVARRADRLIPLTTRGLFQKGAAVEWVARDVAGDVSRLVSSGARLAEPGAGAPPGSRPLVPGDVAVLVRTNSQAGIVHRALRAAGVPAVVAGIESVFQTGAARDWLRLLEALERPASRSRAAAVALGPFLGMRAAAVAEAGERRWEAIHEALHRWSDGLRRRGVGALWRDIYASESLPARLLAGREGERQLTDLGHVAQLLHAEAGRSQLGLPALRAWLARRIAEAERDETEADERSRRLDSDADAVQVLTVHRAKGLEFPVVYCPYLWDGFSPEPQGPVVFHDRADANLRKLDVAGPTAENRRHWEARAAAAAEEARGESLRHLYVALTRAKSQVVIWWAAGQDCHRSSLGRLLLDRRSDGSVGPGGHKEPEDGVVLAELARLAERAPGRLAVEPAVLAEVPVRAGGLAEPAVELGVARLTRPLDLEWRRSSYSAITARSRGDLVGSEPEEPGTSDEPDEALPAPPPRAEAPGLEEGLRAVPSAWAGLPAGAEFGTLVHRVLEQADFSARPLAAELERVVARETARGGPEVVAEELVAALEAALRTPLGPLAGPAPLAGLRRADRLDELAFELPLVGGDRPTGRVEVAEVAALFARHVGAGTRLAGYAQMLADPLLATGLRGYLTGSIDLVFRRPGPDGRGRYFLVDYKTNWLGGAGEALSAWHYRPGVLEAEMERNHYPLQAVLYSVALHRYLRWRLPGYRPEADLGGVLYLFLRGMCGPDGPRVGDEPCGVLSWDVPVPLVTALSDLLARGGRS